MINYCCLPAKHQALTQGYWCSIYRNKLRNMHKFTSTSFRHCGGSATRLTGRREYFHVGSTAAFPAADTCQSSHRTPFQHLSKLFHARSLATGRPFLAITISLSCPCSMASTKRDREDLACNMFTCLHYILIKTTSLTQGLITQINQDIRLKL